MTHEESAQLLGRKLLQLFGDIDDHEVAVFHEHLQKAMRRGAEVHYPRLGAQHVTPPEVRAKAQTALERLELLGLLRFVPEVTEIPIVNPRSRHPGEISDMVPVPRLEQSGSRVGNYWITYLGVRLLVASGLVEAMPTGAENLIVST